MAQLKSGTTIGGFTAFHAGNLPDSVIPLGGIIAIRTGLTGAHPIPSPGTVDSKGFMYCNGAAIPAGNTVQGSTPNLTDGRFLRGATSSGSTGGGDNFTLTTANLPSHSHSFSATTASDGSHSHTGSAAAVGGHTHTYERPNYGSSRRVASYQGWSSRPLYGSFTATGSAGGHSHSLTINSGGSHTHTLSGTTATSGSTSAVTHIPKYFNVVYLIKVN